MYLDVFLLSFSFTIWAIGSTDTLLVVYFVFSRFINFEMTFIRVSDFFDDSMGIEMVFVLNTIYNASSSIGMASLNSMESAYLMLFNIVLPFILSSVVLFFIFKLFLLFFIFEFFLLFLYF